MKGILDLAGPAYLRVCRNSEFKNILNRAQKEYGRLDISKAGVLLDRQPLSIKRKVNFEVADTLLLLKKNGKNYVGVKVLRSYENTFTFYHVPSPVLIIGAIRGKKHSQKALSSSSGLAK